MNECITFPEEKILEVCKVIRLGIQHATRDVSKETKVQLEKQCIALEDYIKR